MSQRRSSFCLLIVINSFLCSDFSLPMAEQFGCERFFVVVVAAVKWLCGSHSHFFFFLLSRKSVSSLQHQHKMRECAHMRAYEGDDRPHLLLRAERFIISVFLFSFSFEPTHRPFLFFSSFLTAPVCSFPPQLTFTFIYTYSI